MPRYDPFDRFRGRGPSRSDRVDGRRLDKLEEQVARLERRIRTMATDINALLDKLTEQTTISAGYRTAVDAKLAALKAQIDALTAGQIDAATQARIDAAFTAASADTDADREATAILEGTPAAGTPVT